MLCSVRMIVKTDASPTTSLRVQSFASCSLLWTWLNCSAETEVDTVLGRIEGGGIA